MTEDLRIKNKKCIRILFVFSNLFSNGGTEKVMMNIFDYIEKERFHIDFLLYSDAEDHTAQSRYLKEHGADIYYIVSRGKSWKRHRKELRSFFESHHYDIVHTHIDAIAAEALKEAKRQGIKCRIAHSHNTAHLLSPHGLKEVMHRLLAEYERYQTRHYATGYIGCSKEAAQWLFGMSYKTKPHFILNNGINIQEFVFSQSVRNEVKKELGFTNEKIIGHVGRLEYQKNHAYLLRVFKCLHDLDSNTVLVLAGKGSLQGKIEALAKQLGIDKHVLFLGQRNDVNRLLMAFDLFLLPSHYEGLGIVLIEAQAAGLPVIASSNVPKAAAVTGSAEFIELKKPPEYWAVRAKELLEKSPDRRKDTVKEISRKGYDIADCIRRLERFYMYCIKMNG